MTKSLLLRSSSIFEDSNTIDCIRQTCIGLKNSPKNEEIQIFLKESIKYLKEDIPFDVLNELFTAILSCFSTNPSAFSPISRHFLKRAKLNSNYLIITVLILSNLIHAQPDLKLPDYQSFIDDAITEILPQIVENEENDIELFGLKISPLFKNNLIVNLLLTCNLTEKLFLSFFPYLFSHNLLSDNPKFNLLLQCISKLGIICISTQNEKSDDDIYQFIKNNGNQSISNLSSPAISLIESVVIFIKTHEKKKIKGLKKETILQFLAVLIIIIKNYKIQEKVSFSSKGLLDLLIEGINYVKYNKSKVLTESIDLIISNYFYINGTLSIPTNTLINIFEILIQQLSVGVYHADKLIFFQTIFDLFDKIKYYNFRNEIQNLFSTNSDLIVKLIVENIDDINADFHFKIAKFDLRYIDQDLFLYKLSNYNCFYQLIYFFENSCINLTYEGLAKVSARLSLHLNMKIKEEKWNEVMTISQYFKKHKLNDIIQPMKTMSNVPLYIKEALFDYSISSEDTIQSIINYILAHPNPEKDDNAFKLLFDKLMLNNDLLEVFLTFIFTKYDRITTYDMSNFLKMFKKEYKKYQADVIRVCKKIFDYKIDKEMLIYKLDLNIENNIPESANKIVSNLFDEVEQKRNNFQAYYCLLNSFSITDYFLSQYCQNSLIKSLIDDVFLPSLNSQCFSSLCDLFVNYASDSVALLTFLSIISQCFTDIYQKCIGFASHFLLKVMYNLIEILSKMTSIEGFKEVFFDTCGNNLINIVLCPELRSDSILLWKVANLFLEFDYLPIRVTQIIYFMILSNNEKVLSAAISLCSIFSYDQLGDLNQFILNIFDNEINNEKRLSIIYIFVKYSPLILDQRRSQLYSILKGLLNKFVVQKNEKIIDLMSLMMNKMAPDRVDFNDISSASDKITEIPQYIKEKEPKFWKLLEKFIEPFTKMINDDPDYLNKFKFLFKYPELVSFKTRSSFFRKKMKELIDNEDQLVLHIDLENILSSSYQSIIDETKENLTKKLYVIFGSNVKTVDFGGPTREFLSKLAKEIFNGKYGLFEISNKMTYQPSSVSYIQTDHLRHFRFAGIFVARALIEGQCIDAHLTTSFIKQILHLKPNLKDLEDVDEQLFNSLTWMLNNDVDSLDMYFEIDSEEFGVHKTIPLKENGNQIKVTNENKKEFVELNSQFALQTKIEEQVKAFCDGFDLLIPHEMINYFSPKEFDLLICGVTDIDVNDFIDNTVFEMPLTSHSPIVLMFFNIIRRWDNDKLSKLLFFMTGSPKVPANGFKEFVQITGFPLKIEAGGDENALPQAHTCFNTIDLPSYRTEEELQNKLLYAIQECNTFELL